MTRHVLAARARAFVVVAVVALAAGCTSSSPMQPSVIDPGAPKITCPAPPASVQAADGSGAIVSFSPPTVTLGAAPLIGPTCNPSSASRFAPGTTSVTCTVTDAKARSDSCSFPVVVQMPPRLALTRFIAFGDSLTAGEVVSEGFGLGFRPLKIDLALAYPTDLQRLITLRYPSQAIVENDGIRGETTAQGLARLPGLLASANQPQVLLLLEGANDLPSGTASAVDAAVRNMDAMVRVGKIRGLRVVVGTLPPQNPMAPTGAGESCVARNGGAPFVTAYNEGLKQMAISENVLIADVYQAFDGNVTTLIDCDGLHPTGAGYQTIADAFFAVITKNFEVTPTLTANPPFTVFSAVPRRR